MGFLSCCSRSILMIINIVFMVLAIFIIILGALVFVISRKFQALFEEYIGSLKEELSGDASGAEMALNVTEAVRPLAIVLIVFGIIMLIISIMGCFGSCCDFKKLLVAYAVTLFIIILVEIVLFALAYTGTFDNQMRQELFDKVRHYKGLRNLDGDSLLWTWIMLDLKCCGLHNYKDFSVSLDWGRELQFDGEIYTNMDVPYACCKMVGDYPSLEIVDPNCPSSPNDYNSYMYEGCWSKIEDIMDEYKIWIFVACIVILVVELLLILLSVCAYFHKDSVVSPF